MTRFQRAFTLMELMAVVIILSLAFALILPIAENSTPAYRLKAGIRTIGSFMESGHAESIASRKPFALVYDFDSSTRWLLLPVERSVDGDSEKKQFVLDETDPEARTQTEYLPENVFFQSIETADGQTSQSGTVTVRFDGSGNRGSHIVTLDIRIEDGAEFQPWSVKYNSLTRSLTYNNGKLSFYKE
jgi:prepilin-type N-terminal cleavage/methylation domain-containing protein